jgi:hypothetical protein
LGDATPEFTTGATGSVSVGRLQMSES